MSSEIREKILKTSLDLFKAISYSKTSVSDIAAQSGIGKGTIYLYFKSKEEIIGTIIGTKISQIIEEKRAYFYDKNISFSEKLEAHSNLVMNKFIATKDLMFGSFENLTGKTLRDIFNIFNKYSTQTGNFMLGVIKLHNLQSGLDDPILLKNIEEFYNYIIGRIVLYVLDTDWSNLDPVRTSINQKIERLFHNLVLTKD